MPLTFVHLFVYLDVLMLKPSILMLCMSIAVGGCSSSQNVSSITNETRNSNQSESANEMVSHIVNDYFMASMKANPISATFNGFSQFNGQFRAPISAENRAKDLALQQRYLNKD